MYNINFVKPLIATITLFLLACSDSGTDSEALTEGENLIESENPANPASTSQFNPTLEGMASTGEPGGDITAIAGLWDGTTRNDDVSGDVNDDANDVVYWSFAANGVLTRFDFQQDGLSTASGENCYVVSDPITVTPAGGNDYSIDNVAVTAVVTGESLSVTFLEADENDLDENGDTEETPVFIWTRLNSPTLEDLNNCNLSTADTPTSNTQPSVDSAGDADLNLVIPDPPTDAASLSTFFTGNFDGQAMSGGGITLLKQADSALEIIGIWGTPNAYYQVVFFVNETVDGTYQLNSDSGIFQIIGGDAVAESFNASEAASDTVTFVWDRDAGLVAGDFAFTAIGDDGSSVNVSGEFNTAIGGDGNGNGWFCNFDDEVISICWFAE